MKDISLLISPALRPWLLAVFVVLSLLLTIAAIYVLCGLVAAVIHLFRHQP